MQLTPKSDVSLLPLGREHLDSFWMWASDPEVTQHLMWECYASRYEAENFLIEIAERHPWFRAIAYRDQIVGSISLERGQGPHACRAELGYVVVKRYCRNGVATAAVSRALESGFIDLDISRIEAFVDPINMASCMVLERNGFRQEGHLQNYILHKGMLKDRILYAATRPTLG